MSELPVSTRLSHTSRRTIRMLFDDQRLPYLLSLTSLGLLAAFLNYKLGNMARCTRSNSLGVPFWVFTHVKGNICLHDAGDSVSRELMMKELSYRRCPPRVLSVMTARAISAAYIAASSRLSSSGKSCMDSEIKASIWPTRESSSSSQSLRASSDSYKTI
jgi:hypothetical protein